MVTGLIQYRREHPEYTARIMLDSGSFSLYQKSKKENLEVNWEEYMDDYLLFLDEWGDELECFVACDDVPDPMNMNYDKAATTWKNYLYMVERLRPELQDKLIPVFHYGEDFDWLRNMLEYKHPDGRPIAYIGLAISLEGTKSIRIAWARECMKIIANSSNPNVKTHAFGVGVKSVLDHITVTSTDATSWVKRAAYGMIAMNDRSVYVSDVQKLAADNRYFGDHNTAFQEEVMKRIAQEGFTLEELETSSEARARYNILDTLDWLGRLTPHSDLTKTDLGW